MARSSVGAKVASSVMRECFLLGVMLSTIGCESPLEALTSRGARERAAHPLWLSHASGRLSHRCGSVRGDGRADRGAAALGGERRAARRGPLRGPGWTRRHARARRALRPAVVADRVVLG